MAILIKLASRPDDIDYSKIVITPWSYINEPQPPICPPWVAIALADHLAKQPRVKSVVWLRGMVDEL